MKKITKSEETIENVSSKELLYPDGLDIEFQQYLFDEIFDDYFQSIGEIEDFLNRGGSLLFEYAITTDHETKIILNVRTRLILLILSTLEEDEDYDELKKLIFKHEEYDDVFWKTRTLYLYPTSLFRLYDRRKAFDLLIELGADPKMMKIKYEEYDIFDEFVNENLQGDPSFLIPLWNNGAKPSIISITFKGLDHLRDNIISYNYEDQVVMIKLFLRSMKDTITDSDDELISPLFEKIFIFILEEDDMNDIIEMFPFSKRLITKKQNTLLNVKDIIDHMIEKLYIPGTGYKYLKAEEEWNQRKRDLV